MDVFEVAVRLRNLLLEGDLHRNEFRRVYEDPWTEALPPGGVPSADGRRKDVERARLLLAEWGFPTDYRDGVVTLRPVSPPAESRTLDLGLQQHAVLAAVRECLEELDPHRLPAIPTHALLLKEYRYADLDLALADGRTVLGTKYQTHVGDTTWLHLRTDGGDVAVPAGGITRLVVLRRRTSIDFDGAENPELLDVPDAGELRFDLRQGRPSNIVELIHAQAVIADLEIRLPRSREDEPFVSIEQIAAFTGQSAEFVRGNVSRICRLDPSLSFEHGGLVRLPPVAERRNPLSGASALVALHDLVTFAGLGAARRLLLCDADLSALSKCQAHLETFLTLARVEVDPPEASCAPAVLQARLDDHELTVITPTGQHRLRPTGLHWHAGQWWVLGPLDGRPLLDGELALDAITDAR